MTTCRYLALLLTAFVLPLPAAQADDEYWDGNRLYMRAGTFHVGNANSTLRLDSQSAIGITLDATQDLGMNRGDTIARIEGLYRFNKTHSLAVLWYDLRRSGSIEAGREIEIGDPPETIPIGARIDSYLNTAILKVGYNYSFYHNDKVELAVGAGLHIMRIGAGVDGEVIIGDPGSIAAESVSVTAPLPVLGGRIGYYITPKVRWIAATDLFFLSLGDYEGQFSDTNLDIEWLFTRHVGVGGGFNLNSLGIRGSPDTDNRFRLTNSLSGVQLYLFLRY